MAYGGYRGDPLLESLQGLGNTIRGVSGDVLTRRRLDLEEERILGAQEQERDLARLRTLATQQAGETELLKTRGAIGLQLSAEERAKSAEARAVELQGPQIAELKSQTERRQTLLPGEVATQKADIAYKGAQTKLAGASAHAANLQAQSTQLQIDAMKAPISVEPIHAMLKETSPGAAQLFEAMFKPGQMTTALELSNRAKTMELFYPGGFAALKVAGLERDLANPDLLPTARVQKLEDLRNARIDMGRNPRDGDDDIMAAIGIRAKEAVTTQDPAQKAQLNAQIRDLTSVMAAMKAKGGRSFKSASEMGMAMGKERMEWFVQSQVPEIERAMGHENIGSLDDLLIEQNELVERPMVNGRPYVTPNEVYEQIAPSIKPASADEMAVYQKGGKLANGDVLPPNPKIVTQADADLYKRALIAKRVHTRTGGDRTRLEQAIGGELQPQAAGPQTPQARAGPALTTPRPAGPFDYSTERTRQEVAAQLRNTLGRDPEPAEVDARMQELLRGRPAGGGIMEKLGRVREFMGQNRPLDLLGRVLPGGGGSPPAPATPATPERTAPAASEAVDPLRGEAIRRIEARGYTPTPDLIRIMLRIIREEGEAPERTSIPGTGSTETQGR